VFRKWIKYNQARDSSRGALDIILGIGVVGLLIFSLGIGTLSLSQLRSTDSRSRAAGNTCPSYAGSSNCFGKSIGSSCGSNGSCAYGGGICTCNERPQGAPTPPPATCNKCPNSCWEPTTEGGRCKQNYCKAECRNGCAEQSIDGGTCNRFCNKDCASNERCIEAADGGFCAPVVSENPSPTPTGGDSFCRTSQTYTCNGNTSVYCPSVGVTPSIVDCSTRSAGAGEACVASSQRCASVNSVCQAEGWICDATKSTSRYCVAAGYLDASKTKTCGVGNECSPTAAQCIKKPPKQLPQGGFCDVEQGCRCDSGPDLGKTISFGTACSIQSTLPCTSPEGEILHNQTSLGACNAAGCTANSKVVFSCSNGTLSTTCQFSQACAEVAKLPEEKRCYSEAMGWMNSNQVILGQCDAGACDEGSKPRYLCTDSGIQTSCQSDASCPAISALKKLDQVAQGGATSPIPTSKVIPTLIPPTLSPLGGSCVLSNQCQAGLLCRSQVCISATDLAQWEQQQAAIRASTPSLQAGQQCSVTKCLCVTGPDTGKTIPTTVFCGQGVQGSNLTAQEIVNREAGNQALLVLPNLLLNLPIFGPGRFASGANIATNAQGTTAERAASGIAYYLGLTDVVDASNRLFWQRGLTPEEAAYYRANIATRLGDAVTVGGFAVGVGDIVASSYVTGVRQAVAAQLARGESGNVNLLTELGITARQLPTTLTQGTLASRGTDEALELLASGYVNGSGNFVQRFRAGVNNVYQQGTPTLADSLTVLGDLHSMSPNDLEVLLYQRGITNRAGAPTGQRFAAVGDYFGKNSALDTVNTPGYNIVQRLTGIQNQIGSERTILLAGNWEPRAAAVFNAYARNDTTALSALNARFRTFGADEVAYGGNNTGLTAELLGQLDFVSLTPTARRGSNVLLQHTDNINLSRYALTPNDLARLEIINPNLANQVTTAVADGAEGAFRNITPHDISVISQATQALDLSPAQIATNINTQARSIMTAPLRNINNPQAVQELARLRAAMDAELSFYRNSLEYGQAVNDYARMFNVNTIGHGHSPIDFLSSPRVFGPNAAIPEGLLTNTNYTGFVNRNGVRIVNFDASLSPNMRLDYGTVLSQAAPINGVQPVPAGGIVNPLRDQTAFDFGQAFGLAVDAVRYGEYYALYGVAAVSNSVANGGLTILNQNAINQENTQAVIDSIIGSLVP